MKKLTDQQIAATYKMISEYHKEHLNQHGVKLPRLYSGKQYTKDALVLVYLAQDYPNTQIISKNELTEFIRQYDPKFSMFSKHVILVRRKDGSYFLVHGMITRPRHFSQANINLKPLKNHIQDLQPKGVKK